MFTIGQSLLPIVANAQELNTAGIVDSFKIDKTDLYVGQRTKVTVNFSEKDGLKLKPGDTLTLTLPPELKGLNTEFLLDDYGTCKVTAGTVVCTFNDKVSTHQNIKGYLNFFIEAANVGTDEKKEIETNFGTNVDKQSVTITGPSSGGGTDPGKPPFFYKTGDMNSGKSDEVRWFLNINLAKEELSRDIVVTDNLQEGQTLNKDSFYIIVDDHIGRRSLTLQELEKQGYGTITFTGDKSFKVVLNKDKARLASFSIGYTSTITEAGKKQDFFKNDYTIDYQVLNGEPVTESGTHPVENMTAGGGAEGNVTPRGTLKIVKHIEGDEEKVIPNVSFKLYKEPNEQVGDVYTTDEKGIIEIPNLQPGKYYVKEVSAPDYIDFDPQAKVNFEVKSDAVNGVKLLIPNKVKTTSIAGTKTWKDDNEKDRPSSIKVDLLQNGKVLDTKEVTAADGWKYKFDNLTVYDANGVAYKYEVKEQPIDGYTTEVNGYDITNTKVVQTTKVEGTKTWKDGNAEGRPTMIKVDLLQNGKVIATQEVSEATGWKYEFKDLAINDADGKAYKYEVKEQAVDGYESKVNGYDITNTKVGKTSVAGTKTWKGGTEEEHKAIKVDLLQNGTVIATQEVSKETGWKYEFKDLVAFDENGKAYKYEVKEQPVDGYESKVNGYDITNTKVGKTSVAGTKTWNDNNASDRPKTIKVDLVQKDNSQAQKETVIATQEVSEATGWKYEFKDLAAYDENGVAYKYEVKEQAVPGYESKVNGYDITNTKVGETKVEGTKTWKDDNAKDRPEMIKVDLLQNGKVVDTKEVTAATEWKYTFEKLQAYDTNGVAYKYEVKEQPIAGYESKVSGTDITNTKVGKTKVEGTKTWKDGNATDRPTMIKVDLLQNGNVIQTHDVLAVMGWKYIFADLEAYDAEGKAYEYEVKEQPVPGYESKVSGTDITNTKVGQTKVEGTKTWKDDNATDRPEMIKVDLLQNGTVIATQEVSKATGWKYEFKDLVAYDENGVAYKYEVKEQVVPGYESKVNGYDITNTKVGETKVEGTKTWKDDNAKDRPEMIKVDLLQNGKVVDTKEVTAETNWKYTFEKLQAYDANGVAYKYEVKEQAIPGYESKVNGTDITNTKVGKTKVEGTKTWKDDNATDRPEMIKVDLLQNGTVIATQEVSKATGWKYEFKDLAAYDENGVAYKYEVKEQAVPGYESKVNGYDITNTKVGETKVEGTKTWKDDNAKDRPEMIKVDLLQNGKVVDTKEVTAATEWKYTFEKLQAYDTNGVAYKYEVKEQVVPGYESKVNGTDITNTKVGETKVEGTKTWKDDNAKDRPEMIKVDLLQNGKVVDTKEVTAETNWKYTFEKLQAYDANGVAYKYEVKEQATPGYESKVNGTDITNTKVGKTKVEGTKTWKDDNATDRPEMIKVDLLQNGTVIATQEVSKATGWKYEFKDLAAYDENGVAYKYEVKEQQVDGYKSEVKGYDITNTKVGETKVEGMKTWKDDNAKDRPEMIKVDLLQNGKVVDTKEVTAATNWKYTFEKLQAYDTNGVAYKYEVKEQAVPGYESKVNGTDITNTKVGKTKVEGTKTWKDDNAKDRPEMIKVDLLQNGTVIATQEVSKATGWKYEFKDLAAYDENGVAYKYEVKEQAVPGYESKVNGTDITNIKVGETKVEGTKTWKDDNATNRPSTIKVDLLQNGKVVDTKEVTAETNWKYTFEKLQAYDANGVAYKYEVKEQPVAGYKSEVKGYDITNTKVAELTVEGTKTWNDNNATDRPSSIKVDLLQNGKVVDTKEVTAATNWKYTFEKLQAYDANGVAYKYEVKEQPVAGYQSDVHGYDITNTKVGETKVEGTKTWNDNNATDRPSSIKVDLLQNGKVVDTKEVTAETNWKYTFEKLQAYDANGVAYKYEVKEQAVPGYESKVNGTDITNTKVGETKVEGTKTWNDNNTTDRPSTIKVDLLQNGKVVDTKEVTAATNWKYTFEKLQAYDTNGVAYKYEVKEQAVPGYESKVNGTDITNTKVGKTKVEGTKTWKDDNAKDRPEMIKVDLLQNGTVIATQEVSEATGWKYEFKDLAAYDAEGKAYKYEVKEQTVPGYESKVSGTDITNTKVGETKVEGTKTWNDNNATDRPSTIKVDLLQNGKVVDTKEVTVETNWKYTFEKLQAYDAEGKAYKYEVKEQAVPGYESKVNGTDITNTKVGETKVEGTKTWKDDNAKDRPEMIKVDLLQNGKVVDTKEVTAATEWKYTFEKLQAYDTNGVAYKYEVKEQPIAGYKSEVKGTDIANTKVGETKVEGTKTWNDNNATDRPSSIKVDLLQNGKVVDTKEVTAETNWKYTFEKLQAYDAEGKAYKYEVKEQPVAGYESKVSGTDITNTKVGKTKVEGTKTWKDDNATDRPEMIKVDLLQNGKVVDTKEVTAETNWKYTFEKLQAYDANGVAYKYEVKEQAVPGYESKVSGTDITNTKVGKTKVEGTKTWNDGNATDRPTMIKVDLLQNGNVIQTQDVLAVMGWKYIFADLEAYDAEGKAYEYTVKEQPVAGYESKVSGTDITNTKIGKTKVEGTKTWKDDNATDRPEMIKVDLLQNGTVIATQEVSKATGWKYEFKDLAAYDTNGVAYKYEVKEQPIAGYKSEVKGTDIANTKVGETKVEGTKTWNDNNATDRPSSIKVDLLQNGKVVDTKEVTAETNWKYTFEKLQAYDAEGKAYKYEVKEQPVAGYESKVSGTDITNTKVGKTKVEGTKTWKDDNATDRPEMIKVDLLQNGKVVDTKEVTAETNWKYTFEKLQAYDANGVAYKYEVKEQPVAGYKSEVKGYDITNTKIKDKPNVDPKDPSTDPKDPSTDPKDPSTDPKNPNTNTGSNSDSKVPSTTENDKPTLLPNTGGTSAGMSSILGGMVLFLLGGILFARQRIK
ncbi:Cna B-type domain-containing protein [Bacillus tropicus]|uniref:Cna B-type domain-containing protein n=3 Tax=Bacillus cereus group TaxID=86661 RepID=A0ABD7ZRU9_9BACI|nr:Cna B-type domain-containing protein [Bacillus tropicus]WMY15606.1 Cna B-type domain-containing protein [Bacillus tropicus]